MLLGRSDRDLLAVPVLPGTRPAPSFDTAPPPLSPPSSESSSWGRRGLIFAGAGVCVAGIAGGTIALSRSPSHPAAVTTLAPVVAAPPTTTPTVVHHHAQRTAAQVAHAAALRVAAKLPVALESAALLGSGSSMYVVGGTTRAGKPSAAEFQIDLATGHVHRIGTFVEPLTGAGAAVHAGALYLAGGWTGEKAATGVLRWTPGGSSSLVARLPVALRSASAAFVGSTLYVWGGGKVFAVDVAAGTVSTVAKPPSKLRGKDSNLDYLIQSQASYR